MPDRYVPYGRQLIEDDDVAAVAAALRSDFLTTGPAVGRFEAALAQATGVRHAVAVNSGTAALHAAYHALGIGPGDEIVTSPLTFAATGNAALYLGARPVFADVDPDTGCLDPAAAEAAISPRTRAVVPVDYAGLPADYDAFAALAGRHGLPVVADAAQSLGASYNGRPAGSLATVSTISFHPVKTITTGEGGAVTTDVDEIALAARRFRSHGMERTQARLRRQDRPAWYHEMQALGFNYRLTDIGCALGTSQLAKLPRFHQRRLELARRYDEAFADLPGLLLPVVPEGRVPAWHLYVVRTVEPARRDPFFEALQGRGIGVQVHYLPVYMHPYYQELGYKAGTCPVAERFAASCLSLPLYVGLSEDDLQFVIETVRRTVADILGR
jgi:UDP-4-amino-4,6-dideoxy-N-acetyl-beta-L-altrosamine transaminase